MALTVYSYTRQRRILCALCAVCLVVYALTAQAGALIASLFILLFALVERPLFTLPRLRDVPLWLWLAMLCVGTGLFVNHETASNWVIDGRLLPSLRVSLWLFVPAMLLLLMGLLRIERWCKHAYREAVLACIMLSAALFLYETGGRGHMLSLSAIVIWHSITPRHKRGKVDSILLLLAFVLAFVPYHYVYTIVLSVIWLKACLELASQEYRDFSLPLETEKPGKTSDKINQFIGKSLYHLFFGAWYVVASLPLSVLYCFSTLISLLMYYILRFRRKVVRKNLCDSFPEKSKAEIVKIERKYYQHVCDLIFESIKYFSISEKEMRERLVYKNLEQARNSLKNGKTIGLYMGHYANWEWVSSLPLEVGDVSQCCQLYHPLENKVFDRLVAYTRERWGGVNIPAGESIRHIVRLKQQGKPLVIGFIADQVPLWQNIHYWTRFLNHEDTPIFTGAERLMKKLDMDVYYLDVRRVKRGYYEAEFKLISSTPKECEEFYLTEQYTRMLEQTINEAPPYWLWSHKRWKRTREEYNRLFPENKK